MLRVAKTIVISEKKNNNKQAAHWINMQVFDKANQVLAHLEAATHIGHRLTKLIINSSLRREYIVVN